METRGLDNSVHRGMVASLRELRSKQAVAELRKGAQHLDGVCCDHADVFLSIAISRRISTPFETR